MGTGFECARRCEFLKCDSRLTETEKWLGSLSSVGKENPIKLGGGDKKSVYSIRSARFYLRELERDRAWL